MNGKTTTAVKIMEYERRKKESKPVLAICYDFDKTLSPDDMQAQGYVQSVVYDVKKFWDEANALAAENDMDGNLAYMYKMMRESEGRFVFNRRSLEEYGAKVKLFAGVAGWFERIKRYGAEHGVTVEHYVISSGLKEMIEGTEIARAGASCRCRAERVRWRCPPPRRSLQNTRLFSLFLQTYLFRQTQPVRFSLRRKWFRKSFRNLIRDCRRSYSTMKAVLKYLTKSTPQQLTLTVEPWHSVAFFTVI